MESSVQVVYTDPTGVGYHCVYYMARLAAQLLNAQFVPRKRARFGLIEQLGGVLPARKSPGVTTLLICPSPTDLNAALLLSPRERSGRIVAWVFDSFWPGNIPRWVRSSRMFDHVFVTEKEDLDAWRAVVRAPVDWLPWGSDVLNLGSAQSARQYDLLRFGRQPDAWEDDANSAQQCEARGLSFHGRPHRFDDAMQNHHELMKLLGDAKFTLAFTNRVSPSIQTHPDREYITGRWTDSLAAGATVAGIPPRSESVQALLWPEALLDLESTEQLPGLEVLASAVAAWTPDRAQLNYLKSLEFLDWRWRFKTLAEALDIRSSQLDAELARLTAILRSAV